jgi:Uma2 family endonuclease
MALGPPYRRRRSFYSAMHQTMQLPATKYTWKDYANLPDDGTRYEILDGEVVMTPSAGSPHQGLQAQLLIEFGNRVQRRGLGLVFGDLDCELSPHDIVRPDLLVVLPEHRDRILRTRIAGTPDLAVEILSPSTARRDRTKKLRRYEAAGTPEVWLVDGKARTITQFVHDGTRFCPGIVRRRTVRPAILPGLVIPLHPIW